MGAPILADYRRQRPDTPFIVSLAVRHEHRSELIGNALYSCDSITECE